MVFSDLQISLQANKVPANKIILFPTGKARGISVPPPDSDRGHFENHHFQIRNVISLYYETKSIDWICIFHGSRKIFFKIKLGKEP